LGWFNGAYSRCKLYGEHQRSMHAKKDEGKPVKNKENTLAWVVVKCGQSQEHNYRMYETEEQIDPSLDILNWLRT